ncbi:vesicle-associated membrane protein [Trypanosoma brucei equiperdum]|uniref:Vesicle-associated membrane protein n=1 Tax=Trypanosoma brucei equiperdum TaxID=630700 RepID=A0A3L6LDC1_9TRYP|nr:vesicle-associated membrane protein [Trypanosoma brucei equiperdum]
MLISASFVSYQRVIVAEHRVTATMKGVVDVMLEQLPRYDTKAVYQYDESVFHFLVENELVYGCVTGVDHTKRVVFEFLSRIRDFFKKEFAGSDRRYPRPSAISFSACSKFGAVLSDNMRSFNETNSTGKLGEINKLVDDTKHTMLGNIDVLIDRGERIELLCHKTEVLNTGSRAFQSSARSLKWKVCMGKMRFVIGTFLLFLFFATISFIFICGTNLKCKK